MKNKVYMPGRAMILPIMLLYLPGTAFGQAPTGPNQSPSSASSGDEATSAPGDIIVTAQKRSTSLQKTAAAVSVISAANLESAGVTNLQNITARVTGVNTGSAGPEFEIFIRGIGPSASALGIDSPVGVNIDGVATSRWMTKAGLFDLDRIEILPGPQGTLYGSPAAGGVLNVNTRNPGKVFAADGFAEYGNYNAFHVKGGLDILLGDKVQLRVAYDHVEHGPYYTRGFYDTNDNNVRATLAFQPSDRLTGNIKFAYSQSDSSGNPVVGVPRGSDPYRLDATYQKDLPFVSSASGIGPFTVGQLDGLSKALLGRPINFAGQSTLNNFFGRTPLDGFDGFHQKAFFVSGRFDYDLGGATLTYVPGFQHITVTDIEPIGNEGNLDAAGNPLTPSILRTGRHETRTVHELRLANNSASDRLSYLLGAYYEYDRNTTPEGTWYGAINTSVSSRPSITNSYAGYGQLTYAVTDKLHAIGGLRYTHDTKSATFRGTLLPTVALALSPVAAGGCANGPGTYSAPCLAALSAVPDYTLPGNLPITPGELKVHVKDNRLDYKVGLQLDLTSRNMLYGTVQSGFLRAGYSDNGGIVSPTKLTSFTVGSKNRLFDGRLTLNIEGFYYDYRDLQVVFTTAAGASIAYNVPKSQIFGAEVSSSITLGQDTNLNLGVTVLPRARYQDFDLTREGVTNPSGQFVNLSGKRLAHAPRFSANLNLAHTFHLGDYKVVAESDNYFSSSYSVTFDNGAILDQTAGLSQRKYWNGVVNVAFGPNSDRWSIGGFIRNIDNVAVAQSALGGMPSHDQFGEPRTYGMRATFKY